MLNKSPTFIGSTGNPFFEDHHQGIPLSILTHKYEPTCPHSPLSSLVEPGSAIMGIHVLGTYDKIPINPDLQRTLYRAGLYPNHEKMGENQENPPFSVLVLTCGSSLGVPRVVHLAL